MSTYDERVLPDDYPVFWGYLYVVGNRVFQNLPGFKTIGEMKKSLIDGGLEEKDVVITSCDIVGRELEELAV